MYSVKCFELVAREFRRLMCMTDSNSNLFLLILVWKIGQCYSFSNVDNVEFQYTPEFDRKENCFHLSTPTMFMVHHLNVTLEIKKDRSWTVIHQYMVKPNCSCHGDGRNCDGAFLPQGKPVYLKLPCRSSEYRVQIIPSNTCYRYGLVHQHSSCPRKSFLISSVNEKWRGLAENAEFCKKDRIEKKLEVVCFSEVGTASHCGSDKDITLLIMIPLSSVLVVVVFLFCCREMTYYFKMSSMRQLEDYLEISRKYHEKTQREKEYEDDCASGSTDTNFKTSSFLLDDCFESDFINHSHFGLVSNTQISEIETSGKLQVLKLPNSVCERSNQETNF